jgi:hypothetical protein
MKKSTEALLLTDQKIGLEFNAEKSRYTFMSCEQNSNINVGNKSIEIRIGSNISKET